MPMYSDKVMDHFMNPRNVGDIADPDGVGEVGNPVCGDMMTFAIKVEDGRIADVRFKTFGCGAAIAVSSMVSEMAIGKTIAEAMEIANEMVAEELGGLPTQKLHCSNLGADALHAAIEDYLARQSGEPAPPSPARELERCPVCEESVEDEQPYCRKCKCILRPCSSCGKIVSADLSVCPHCGAGLDAAGNAKDRPGDA